MGMRKKNNQRVKQERLKAKARREKKKLKRLAKQQASEKK